MTHPEVPWQFQFSLVQSLSCVQLFATSWTAIRQASLYITKSQSLFKLMSIESVMAFKHLILWGPLLSSAFNHSQHQGLFKWVSSSNQVAKYWSFSFNISPSSEHSGLISFRMDWLDLQGTLKSVLKHHSSKASILWHSAFFFFFFLILFYF